MTSFMFMTAVIESHFVFSHEKSPNYICYNKCIDMG